MENIKTVLDMYGSYYYDAGTNDIYEAKSTQSYYFKTYIGKHSIDIDFGDSLYYISDDKKEAYLKKGPAKISSLHCGTVIRGFMGSPVTASLTEGTVLPYVNGCSTRQIIYPQRLGDPTLQFLKIPAFSKEQAHHIHSSARVVYILNGSGESIVGMEGKSVSVKLETGMVCVIEPMCPHHFETPHGEHLEVVPLHVFSSVGSLETSHPMFNGTYLMNQK
ncbi:MAG: cupin domain-containing protein [Gammaproteobacteria bacterium]|nr:cupin domain-containing protein [Gammaproteobacteria bacterium]